MMRYSVVIPTVNRAAVLHDTVLSILRQSVKPEQIVIVVPDARHVSPETAALDGVEVLTSVQGSSIQRNRGLDAVHPDVDLVVFFDDDVELAITYMAEMIRVFERETDVRVASGALLRDGGLGKLVTRIEARELCRTAEAMEFASAAELEPRKFGYGCNMVVRFAAVGHVRFDERLPLYAWLEDSDYSHECTKDGRGAVTALHAIAVHMGWRAGKMGGKRFGFSQIVNPYYLWKKSRVFALWFIVVHYWLRCLVGNLLGIVTRDPERDRLALLAGNALGLAYVLSGGDDPQAVLGIDGGRTIVELSGSAR